VSGWFDYHTHSRFCDGAGDLREYAAAARDMGLVTLGLSGHAPCATASEWHMKAADLPAYLAQGRSLAAEHAGALEILVGLEADYVPGEASPRAVREETGSDFVIGSVHYLGRLSDGTPWTVDGSREELARGVRESFGEDMRLALTRYFELVAEMAGGDKPDIIGHFDLVKKHNKGLFDENAGWYLAAMTAALEAIRGSGCVVEINTGAVSRGYRTDYYPGDATLAAMAGMGIPVTLGSDAHRPQHLAAHFAGALDSLHRAGYRECWRLSASGWKAVALDSLR
jgi:histidinol-phosphatase (PHP family)